MTKENFISLVSENILPLFIGAEIQGECESSSRDSEVALGAGGTVLLKAHKQDEYRIILKRTQPFKSDEVSLLKGILSEIVKISELNTLDAEYIKILQRTAIEKAICDTVTTCASKTLLGIISEVGKWGNRTYEGRRPSLGIVVNETTLSQNHALELHYTKILKQDFFALLSDGRRSFVEVDKEGFIMGHVLLQSARTEITLTPREFEGIAKFCNDKKIGISLLESGDLLIFKNRTLLYAKRRGVWNIYCHDEVIQLLSYRTTYTIKDIRKAVYLTALDCSFTSNGGCIVYINKDKIEQALLHIDAKDILTESHFNLKKNQELEESEKLYNLGSRDKTIKKFDKTYESFLQDERCFKSECLRCIIQGRKFQELNRKLREELVAMDGATIIDFDGTIVAIGAIIKIEAGSEGGGRLAATKTLAKYGVAIKISTDGILQGFGYDKRYNTDKIIFSVG